MRVKHPYSGSVYETAADTPVSPIRGSKVIETRSGKFLKIAITKESPWEGEADDIERVLTSGGFDFVHLRHPYASAEDMTAILSRITQSLLHRVTLHDFYRMADAYGIGGLHLNSRHTLDEVSSKPGMRISKSCHSLAELERCRMEYTYDYATLSPVYDSLSKPGYKSQFRNLLSGDCRRELKEAGLPVIALGGVTAADFEELEKAGFAGAAMIGAAWD